MSMDQIVEVCQASGFVRMAAFRALWDHELEPFRPEEIHRIFRRP